MAYRPYPGANPPYAQRPLQQQPPIPTSSGLGYPGGPPLSQTFNPGLNQQQPQQQNQPAPGHPPPVPYNLRPSAPFGSQQQPTPPQPQPYPQSYSQTYSQPYNQSYSAQPTSQQTSSSSPYPPQIGFSEEYTSGRAYGYVCHCNHESTISFRYADIFG